MAFYISAAKIWRTIFIEFLPKYLSVFIFLLQFFDLVLNIYKLLFWK